MRGHLSLAIAAVAMTAGCQQYAQAQDTGIIGDPASDSGEWAVVDEQARRVGDYITDVTVAVDVPPVPAVQP